MAAGLAVTGAVVAACGSRPGGRRLPRHPPPKALGGNWPRPTNLKRKGRDAQAAVTTESRRLEPRGRTSAAK